MRNYTGKEIFLGIDVHKKSYSVTAIIDQEIVKKDKIIGTPESLEAYCKKYFYGANIKSAYEAGFCGFALHRFLQEKGMNNIVIHPSNLEIASRERVKTDRRDSQKIAVQLSVGRLKGICVPDIKRENFRLLSRHREMLSKERAKKATQIKSFLYKIGKMPYDQKNIVSKEWLRKILNLEFSYEECFCLKSFSQQWLQLSEDIRKIEAELSKQAKEDSELENIYKSIPGIGSTIARILANELGDMSQFPNERTLSSYTGLTPREYSSGEHRRLSHISRQGKPILRKMLIQAAWAAINCDQELREVYERIYKRAGAKRAIVAVARRIIIRAKSCIKEKRLYKNFNGQVRSS
jgi:transposase